MRPPGVLMCAVEAPDRSLPGMRAAGWLAGELAARLQLVHVFDPMGIPVPAIGELARWGLSTADFVRGARVRAHAELADAARRLADIPLETAVLEGAVVCELVRYARERGASVLVTATAARGPVDWMLAGSVSADLAARAPCPVLVVPGDAVVGAPGP